VGLVQAAFAWAGKTTALADATQSDVAAQFQPIIAPIRFVEPRWSAPEPRTVVDPPSAAPIWCAAATESEGGLKIALTNIGRGAALNVRARIRDSQQVPNIFSFAIGVDTEPEVIILPGPVPHREGVRSIEEFYDGANGSRWVSQIDLRQPTAVGWKVVLVKLASAD
jgi:hypothetical protein